MGMRLVVVWEQGLLVDFSIASFPGSPILDCEKATVHHTLGNLLPISSEQEATVMQQEAQNI